MACSEKSAVDELQKIINEYEKNSKKVCPICGNTFYKSNGVSKYCEQCKKPENIGKIRQEKRTKSVRYLHKRIYDTVHNSSKFDDETLKELMDESNYYWNNVTGKIQTIDKKNYYRNINEENEYRKWLECTLQNLKSMRTKTIRKIRQIDKLGNTVAEYESAKQAREKTGYFESNILNCCRGKIKTYKGFIWKFSDESEF